MTVMKDLDLHIEEYSCQDRRVYELMKFIVNLHVQGKLTYQELPREAQECFGRWEQEKKLEADYDKWAKELEEQELTRIHDTINFQVKNGLLDHDTGLRLINNPEEAKAWHEKGAL